MPISGKRISDCIRVSFVNAERMDESFNDELDKAYFHKMIDYVESNFPIAASRLFSNMLSIEAFANLETRLDLRRTNRNQIAKLFGKLEEQRVRRSITVPRGRTPHRKTLIMEIRGIDEFDKCAMKARDICRKRGYKNFNKTRLAEEMFPNSSNPLRDLRAYLRKYRIDFVNIEELVIADKK